MQRYAMVTAVLHTVVDGLLLMGANQLCGYPQNGKRILLASFLGGGFVFAYMMPGFHFLGNTVWRLSALLLTAMLAFGLESSSLRSGIVFGVLHLAVQGVAEGTKDPWKILLAASAVFLLSLLGFGDGAGKQYLPIRILYGGKTAQLTALVDTGNRLQDPMTGESVLVVGPKVAETLLGIPEAAVADPVGTMERFAMPGMRLLPYRTIDNPAGMLLGMRFPVVYLGRKQCAQVVAFAPRPIGEGKRFEALAGGLV